MFVELPSDVTCCMVSDLLVSLVNKLVNSLTSYLCFLLPSLSQVFPACCCQFDTPTCWCRPCKLSLRRLYASNLWTCTCFWSFLPFFFFFCIFICKNCSNYMCIRYISVLPRYRCCFFFLKKKKNCTYIRCWNILCMQTHQMNICLHHY